MPKAPPEKPVGLDLARALVTCALANEGALMADLVEEASAEEIASAVMVLSGLFAGSLCSSALVANGADPLEVWQTRIVDTDEMIGW